MRLRSRLPGVDVPVKVVGTEVDDRGLLVGEEMPDDHQDRAADDDGPIFPSPSGGSPPPGNGHRGLGPAGHDGLTENSGEIAVAVPGSSGCFHSYPPTN